jgi:arylsulfatase A-like enzyme
MNRRAFLKLLLAVPAYGLLRTQFGQLVKTETDPSRPNILVLVLDTLSAHNTSLHGYGRETTPQLNRFAQHATVYHRHYAAGNFTSPGTASLLTGTYPWQHRAFHINGTVTDAFRDRQLFSALGGSGYQRTAYTHNSLVLLLLDQLKSHLERYVPARELSLFDDLLADRLFVKDFDAAFLGEKLTLPKNDDSTPSSLFLSLFDGLRRTNRIQETRLAHANEFPRGTPRADADTRYFLLEDAINWMATEMQASDQPYLLYAHLYPPHNPYNSRHEFIDFFRGDNYAAVTKPYHILGEEMPQEALDRHRQQYDDFLLYTDAEFGRLYDMMQNQGILENTVVVVTSDHGQLFERGLHGHITPLLYEPVLRVPLVIARPGQSSREDIFTATSCVDLLPTLAHMAGRPIPAWTEGQLLPGLGGPTGTSNGRPIYALEAKNNPKHAPLTEFSIALIKEDLKLIGYFGYDQVAEGYEMYHLGDDPDELNNLYSPDDPTAAELRVELQAKVVEVNRPFTRQ